jgi:hypothetical protein
VPARATVDGTARAGQVSADAASTTALTAGERWTPVRQRVAGSLHAAIGAGTETHNGRDEQHRREAVAERGFHRGGIVARTDRRGRIAGDGLPV